MSKMGLIVAALAVERTVAESLYARSMAVIQKDKRALKDLRNQVLILEAENDELRLAISMQTDRETRQNDSRQYQHLQEKQQQQLDMQRLQLHDQQHQQLHDERNRKLKQKLDFQQQQQQLLHQQQLKVDLVNLEENVILHEKVRQLQEDAARTPIKPAWTSFITNGLHPGSARFMRTKAEFQPGDFPTLHLLQHQMGFRAGVVLQVNFGASMTTTDGMVMARDITTNQFGYVPYGLMDRVSAAQSAITSPWASSHIDDVYSTPLNAAYITPNTRSHTSADSRLSVRLDEARADVDMIHSDTSVERPSKQSQPVVITPHTTALQTNAKPNGGNTSNTNRGRTLSRDQVHATISFHSNNITAKNKKKPNLH
eukprot:m.268703 g.268703  ORF g.268703 m.268703 type:complete len:370 (-) comp79983_c0_seq1:27-1136(-)